MTDTISGLEICIKPMKDTIQGYFVPVLLGCMDEEAAKLDFRTMLTHRVKQGSLNIRKPVEAAPQLRHLGEGEGSAAKIHAGGDSPGHDQVPGVCAQAGADKQEGAGKG